MRRLARNGFTLVEVLTVIIIIGILIGLVVPLAGSIRTRARATQTASFIQQLGSAIDRYYQDFKAYPGPLTNNQIRAGVGVWGAGSDFDATFPGNSGAGLAPVGPYPAEFKQWDANSNYLKITMAENLVLGLLGGLKLELDPTGTIPRCVYDPAAVGTGARSLNPGNIKKYEPYLQIQQEDLSWQTHDGKKTGEYFDEVTLGTGPDPGGAEDSIIPEFVDRFSDPMPILYLRARRGAARVGTGALTDVNNGIVNRIDENLSPPSPDTRNQQQYDIDQILAYTQIQSTGYSIGVGRKAPKYFTNGAQMSPQPDKPFHGLRTAKITAVMSPKTDTNYEYPYDAFPYLRNAALSGPTVPPIGTQVAREKDKYILISAGIDRIYGTDDDITSFGSVAQ